MIARQQAYALPLTHSAESIAERSEPGHNARPGAADLGFLLDESPSLSPALEAVFCDGENLCRAMALTPPAFPPAHG